MMAYELEQSAAQADGEMMTADPAVSVHDPRTYDPTQGPGTDAWQAAKKRQAEHNAKLGLETNAMWRRN